MPKTYKSNRELELRIDLAVTGLIRGSSSSTNAFSKKDGPNGALNDTVKPNKDFDRGNHDSSNITEFIKRMNGMISEFSELGKAIRCKDLTSASEHVKKLRTEYHLRAEDIIPTITYEAKKIIHSEEEGDRDNKNLGYKVEIAQFLRENGLS